MVKDKSKRPRTVADRNAQVVQSIEREKRKAESSPDNNTTTEMALQLQYLESQLFEVREQLDRTTADVKILTQCNDGLKAELDHEKHKSTILRTNMNELEQYSRRNNVRIFGLRDNNKNESSDQTEALVRDLFRNKLHLNFSPSDFEICHRIGRYSEGADRTIIVKFALRKARNAALYNRKKLRGQKISIAEDLTITNLRRMQHIKALECVTQAWSKDGRLFAKNKGGNVKEIKNEDILTENIFEHSNTRDPKTTSSKPNRETASDTNPANTPKPASSHQTTTQSASTTPVKSRLKSPKAKQTISNNSNNNNNNNNCNETQKKDSTQTPLKTQQATSGVAPSPDHMTVTSPPGIDLTDDSPSTPHKKPQLSSTPINDRLQSIADDTAITK